MTLSVLDGDGFFHLTYCGSKSYQTYLGKVKEGGVHVTRRGV
jgi:hypothetical protein